MGRAIALKLRNSGKQKMGVNISIKNIDTGKESADFDSMRKHGDSEFVDLVIEDWFDNFKTDYENEFFGDYGAKRPKDFNSLSNSIVNSSLPDKQRFLGMVELLSNDEKLAINISD